MFPFYTKPNKLNYVTKILKYLRASYVILSDCPINLDIIR